MNQGFVLLPDDLGAPGAAPQAGAIAVLHGEIRGAALERALGAPLRLGLPGVTLGWGGDPLPWSAIEAVAQGAARRWLLCGGRTLSATEALEFGLVDALVDGDARTLAESWTAGRSALARSVLARLFPPARLSVAGLEARERAVFALLFSSPDPGEGIAAFLQRRTPRFE